MQLNKIIAIDGPAASGKSTVSKAVAKKLNFIYVDSGAMYRAIAWASIQKKIDGTDENKVLKGVTDTKWDFFVDEGEVKFSLDNKFPQEFLRSKIIDDSVSNFAKLPLIREFVRGKLRSHALLGSLVLEGRDIGSVVFPDANFKFYLDADPKERALRRHREFLELGESDKAEEVLSSINRRDSMDSQRKHNPLHIAEGATVIDTTKINIDKVVRLIISKIMES